LSFVKRKVCLTAREPRHEPVSRENTHINYSNGIQTDTYKIILFAIQYRFWTSATLLRNTGNCLRIPVYLATHRPIIRLTTSVLLYFGRI